MPQYKDKPVSFISINTRDPIPQAQAEIKRFKMDYPVYFAKGTNINRDFKVKVLPRIILVDQTGKVRSDQIYLEEKELKAAIDKLLAEVKPAPTAAAPAKK